MGQIGVLAEVFGVIFCAYLFSTGHPGDMLWGLPPDGGATNRPDWTRNLKDY